MLDGWTGADVATINTGIGDSLQSPYGVVDPLTGYLYVFNGLVALVFDGRTRHLLHALHRPIDGMAVDGRRAASPPRRSRS